MNVLSEPTLAISVGHRPANSRPADPTREYEPGSGESHDPAPVHRPHLPRSPPQRSVRGGQARIGGRPSGLKGASHRAFARRPAAALDPGASATAAAGKAGRPRPAPNPGACPPRTPVRSLAYRRDGGGSDHHAPQAPRRDTHQSTNRDNSQLAESKSLTGPFHMNIHSVLAYVHNRDGSSSCTGPKTTTPRKPGRIPKCEALRAAGAQEQQREHASGQRPRRIYFFGRTGRVDLPVLFQSYHQSWKTAAEPGRQEKSG